MMKSINVVLDWFPNTNHAGFFVALHKGYYKEAGLDVNIRGKVHGVMDASQADIIVSPQPSLMTGMDAGEKLTAVAVLTQKNDSGILTLKESGVQGPSDLTGKRLSHWAPAWFHSVIGKVVNDNGGDYSKIQLIQKDVGDIEAALGAEVDAVWIYKNWEYYVMIHAGKEVNYFELTDYGPLYDFCAPAVVATHALIDDAPQALRAFLAQTDRGYIEAARDTGAAADILARYMQDADKSDPQLVRESLAYIADRFLDSTGHWGYMKPERWNIMADYLVEQGLIKGRMEREFTNEFLSR
jgi:ABC-type nitrate/sulfonate/bicarbonate transport system substrate-binding protein